MLTLRDFLDFCDLTEEEVTRIVERDHVPPIVAAQLALLRRQGIDPASRSFIRPLRAAPTSGSRPTL